MLGVHRFFFVQVEARAEPTKYRPKMRRYFSDMTVSASLRPTGFPRLLVYQRMQFGSVANETFASEVSSQNFSRGHSESKRRRSIDLGRSRGYVDLGKI